MSNIVNQVSAFLWIVVQIEQRCADCRSCRPGKYQFKVLVTDPACTNVNRRDAQLLGIVWIDCTECRTIRKLDFSGGGRPQIKASHVSGNLIRKRNAGKYRRYDVDGLDQLMVFPCRRPTGKSNQNRRSQTVFKLR